MFFILLTIVCSAGIALLLKHNITKKGNELIFLSSNYLTASVISGIMFFVTDDQSYSIYSLLFGSVLGFLFLVGFLSFSKAVSSAGTSLAAVSSRLSVVVIVIFSVIFFTEYPDFVQSIGIMLSVLTVILFYFSVRNEGDKTGSGSGFFYLVMVLLLVGINDFSMKVFTEYMPVEEKQFFLTTVFFFAFLYSISFSLFKGYRFGRQTFLRGISLGIPNLFSSVFLISALNQIPAIIVYPVVGIGVIILTAFAAWLIWKEKINLIGYIAILSGIISVFLLSYN